VFILLSIFFWLLYCLSFFNLWFLLTPFVIFKFFLIFCNYLREIVMAMFKWYFDFYLLVYSVPISTNVEFDFYS